MTLAFLLASTVAFADDLKPSERSLSISPAAEPRPALKHSLWRTSRERTRGNGATHYYRAIILQQQSAQQIQKQFPPEKTETWLDVPLSELPKDDVTVYVDLHKLALEEVGFAASRDECHWNLRVDELQGNDVLSLRIPEMQAMRDLARTLAYKARLEVSQGHFEDAIETLRTGYQVAHDCAEPPLLICSLVGMAAANYMHVAATDLIDAPGSPNLYWGLKQLPHPIVSLRPALEFELSMPYQMFPFLKDAETKRRTPEEWQRLTHETLANLNALAADSQSQYQDWQIRLAATGMMIKAYPEAKRQLVESGLDKDAVEKMPVAQVIAIQASRNYRYTYEEAFKWTLLPYPEGRTHLKATMDRLKSDGYIARPFSDKEVLPIASLLMPELDKVLLAGMRTERRQAALETLEAIRMHAAARKGELPASLEQLSSAPAAKNPFTGQHFDYRVERGRAVLEERSPGFDPVQAQDRVYLIELLKDVK